MEVLAFVVVILLAIACSVALVVLGLIIGKRLLLFVLFTLLGGVLRNVHKL